MNYNTFSNALTTGSWAPHLRGTGINAINAQFTAAQNTFTGFSEAIWHHTGGFTKQYFPSARIRYNTITDCIHGIVTVDTELDEILHNTIVLSASPEVGYANDDPEQGYDYPVGIYTQGSHRFHIEGNVIVGNELAAQPNFWSYGMVINQNNGLVADNTSVVHMNEIGRVDFGIQCEGDNRGNTFGAGVMIECNEFGQTLENDVRVHDIAIASNWMYETQTIPGVLRDQGSCALVNTQAANRFSMHNTGDAYLEHLYFDDVSQLLNGFFHYQDDPSMLPIFVETNAPIISDCLFSTARSCSSLHSWTKPFLTSHIAQLKSRVQGLKDSLIYVTDSLEVMVLERKLDDTRARHNIALNSSMRHVLEFEQLDSLYAILIEGEGLSRARLLLQYHLERNEMDIVDSLISVIIDEEGGITSDHTLLWQLRASIHAGQSVNDSLISLLYGMVSNNPLGAWNPKAILSQLRGVRYSRVPWMLNDTIPGIRSLMGTDDDRVQYHVSMAPNPTNAVLQVRCNGCEIGSLRLIALDGREVAHWQLALVPEAWLNVGSMPEGTYLLEVIGGSFRSVERIVVLR